jgi:hypothetical protein
VLTCVTSFTYFISLLLQYFAYQFETSDFVTESITMWKFWNAEDFYFTYVYGQLFYFVRILTFKILGSCVYNFIVENQNYLGFFRLGRKNDKINFNFIFDCSVWMMFLKSILLLFQL